MHSFLEENEGRNTCTCCCFRFDKYVGKYDMGHRNLSVISRDSDKLVLQVPNQPQYQLFPVSKTEYFMKESSIRVTFKANDVGKTIPLF